MVQGLGLQRLQQGHHLQQGPQLGQRLVQQQGQRPVQQQGQQLGPVAKY